MNQLLLPEWGWTLFAVAVVLALVVIIVLIILSDRKKEKQDVETDDIYAAKKKKEDEPVKSKKGKDDEDEEVKKSETKGATEQKERTTVKTYHISQSKDGLQWQVKAAGGSKALKLFKTQKEAIDYAKQVAGNQDANIMIHKKDGTFRKLDY